VETALGSLANSLDAAVAATYRSNAAQLEALDVQATAPAYLSSLFP
jgi:hypothetical protein